MVSELDRTAIPPQEMCNYLFVYLLIYKPRARAAGASRFSSPIPRECSGEQHPALEIIRKYFQKDLLPPSSLFPLLPPQVPIMCFYFTVFTLSPWSITEL